MTAPTPTLAHKLQYSAPMVPVSLMHAPALAILPALYAKHGSVSLAAIGVILVLSRLIDAVTDPLIGFLSDRTRGRFGPRKPWILAGTVVSCIGVYFWFRPGADAGWVYFMVWSMVVYLGWTLVEIPHAAWLSELTQDYDQRSRVSAFRLGGRYLGYALFFSLPFLPIFSTTEMTPEVTAVASWFVILGLPLTVIILVSTVPQGQVVQSERPKLKGAFLALLKNRPLQLYMGSYLCIFLASGLVSGLYFFYLDSYLNILEKLGHIGLVAATVSVFASAFWGPLVSRIGKQRTLALGAALNVIVLLGMGLIQPGAWAFPGMLALFSLSALLNAGSTIAGFSLLADIVDYETLRSGVNRAGNFYALQALAEKFGLAVGAGMGFVVVAAFGFEATGNNDTRAMFGFFLSFIVLPMILYALSAVLAWLVPIDKRRHAIVLRGLNRRIGQANPDSPV